MTQCYLVGELSVRIAGLSPQQCPDLASAVSQLRERVERAPVPCLPPLVAEALTIADEACWALLMQGDAEAFAQEAAGALALSEFAVCADLLP